MNCSTTTEITITIDHAALTGYSDSHLATLWHVGQVNPAAHGDRAAGELAERIGREIIRRWLCGTEPELWHHQGRDYYWSHLCKFGTWDAAGVFVPNSTAPDPAGEAKERE